MNLLLLPLVFGSFAVAQIQFEAQPNGTQASNQPQGTGSITGKVVNGITGEPIKNASVSAPGAQGKGARPTTDESGQFQLTGLPAMTTSVIASAQAYPGLFGMGMASHVVTLSAGESQSGIVLKLYPGGVITGRIVDDGGDPMSGCNVTAMQAGQQANFGGRSGGRRRGGGNPGSFGAGQTNDRGEYRLSNIAAGRYVLEAQCFENIPVERPFGRRNEDTPRVSRVTWAPMFYPAASTPDEATVTAVLPGAEIAGIDFQMHVATTLSVRGRIVGSAGDENGMAANCQLVPYNGLTPEPRMAQYFNANPSTGAFMPLSVLPGNYRATCTRMADQKAGKFEVGTVDIHVGNEPPEPVTLQLSPGVPVEGILDEPPTQNTQQASPQTGVVNAGTQPSVSLFPNGQPIYGNFPQANVDESGHFELSNVSPGSYIVNVQPRDYRHYVQSITWAQKPVAGNEIEVAPGESGPLRITMGANVGALNVTVEGAPQSGGQTFVYAIPTDRKPDQQSMSPIGIAQGTTTVQSDHMRPGSYNVFVTSSALPATEEVMELFAKLGRSVNIAESSQQSVTLALLDNDAVYQVMINSLQNPAP